jgi:hypothetical protein
MSDRRTILIARMAAQAEAERRSLATIKRTTSACRWCEYRLPLSRSECRPVGNVSDRYGSIVCLQRREELKQDARRVRGVGRSDQWRHLRRIIDRKLLVDPQASYAAIAATLRREGIPTLRQGGTWTAGAVESLRRRRP